MAEDDIIKYYDMVFKQTMENRKAALSIMTVEELRDLDVKLEEMQFNLRKLLPLVNKELKIREREAIRRDEAKIVRDHKTGKKHVNSTKKSRAKS